MTHGGHVGVAAAIFELNVAGRPLRVLPKNTQTDSIIISFALMTVVSNRDVLAHHASQRHV